MFDFVIKGGPVLWVIFALAAAGTAVVIERLLYFRKMRVDEDTLFMRVRSALEKGHFDEALAMLDTSPSPLSYLMKVGIENRDESEHVQKELIKDAAAQEVPRLERWVGALGTIASVAPLLGLLGTVTGTMAAFGVLGQFGAVSDPSVLAKGVSEALITTVGGIVVAVPAVIFYNYLTGKVNAMIVKLENQVAWMIKTINASKAGRRP